ncbi:MAG TPA: rhamnogalacturonan lyase [Polyangiaceae bacterium]
MTVNGSTTARQLTRVPPVSAHSPPLRQTTYIPSLRATAWLLAILPACAGGGSGGEGGAEPARGGTSFSNGATTAGGAQSNVSSGGDNGATTKPSSGGTLLGGGGTSKGTDSSGGNNPNGGAATGAVPGAAGAGALGLGGAAKGGSSAKGGATSGPPTANGGSIAGGTSAKGGASAGGNAMGSQTSAGGSSGVAGAATIGGSSASGSAACGVTPSLATGVLQMENLCRGVVSVRSGSDNFVSWRIMGYEPTTTTFNVYRDGAKVASALTVSNYVDTGAPGTATYTVRAVSDGVEGTDSSNSRASATPANTWPNDYLDISLTPPPGGTDAEGTKYTYDANDGMVGDLDGDGEYEILLKWDPTNAKDNSQSGHTGNVYIDAYKLSGKRLWRIDLGVNIRAGAHYSQPVVYDLDGDGKAEVAVKTAPGTKDATGAYLSNGPASNDTDTTDYRNSSGYVLTGPEYLTVFNGATGKEMATINFVQARGTVGDWGDTYGNRVDRFLSSAAFVSDTGSGNTTSGKPAILMARGYYTRATVTAYTFREGSLKVLWEYDSGSSTSATASAYGQGAHSMVVADTDGDLAQEVIFGAATIGSDGKFVCSTGHGHGDALHVGDLVPTRVGLEVFMPHEDKSKPAFDVRDANTCASVFTGPVTGEDNGRGAADDVDSSNPGSEFWSTADDNLHAAATGSSVGAVPGSTNFLIYWDGDESRELEDATHIDKYSAGKTTRLLTGSDVASNNSTKSTPVLTADLFGDWREEIIWRKTDNSALRIYTTTAPTTRRIYTLMHDPQYRMQVSSEQTAYNQPPHTSFWIGSGMSTPPVPKITVR